MNNDDSIFLTLTQVMNNTKAEQIFNPRRSLSAIEFLNLLLFTISLSMCFLLYTKQTVKSSSTC
jgi:hypothetical protein